MTTATPTPQKENSLAIVSLVLGIVSLTGPGLLLGIPAIVTAIIALKKGPVGRNFSIAGLITGIVSTVLSLLFLAFIGFLVIWGMNHPETFYDPAYPLPEHYQDTAPRGSQT